MVVIHTASQRATVDSSVEHWNDIFGCLLLLLGCHTRPDLVSIVALYTALQRAAVDSSVEHWNDRAKSAPTAFCQAEQRS